MTKAQLQEKIVELEELVEERELELDDITQKLSAEIDYLRDLLSEHGYIRADVDEDFVAPEDGKMNCAGKFKLMVRKGYTEKEMEKLMRAGKKMIDWCEKHQINLDGKGSCDDN